MKSIIIDGTYSTHLPLPITNMVPFISLSTSWATIMFINMVGFSWVVLANRDIAVAWVVGGYVEVVAGRMLTSSRW